MERIKKTIFGIREITLSTLNPQEEPEVAEKI